jgi:RNA polymerase sigma-70 factor (ECF subfamily)
MSERDDDTGVRRILREYGALLVRVAAGYADTAADRDDLVQEIVIALWRALPSFRGESSERTFVFRVAHNRGISYSLRRRRFEPLPDAEGLTDPAPGPEATLVVAQEREHLFGAIRRLPEAQRQAVMLRLEGLSRSEIAQVQGTTENNVGVRLTRAHRALRVMLGEAGL